MIRYLKKTLLIGAGLATTAWAQPLIDTSFSATDVPGYADGDLANQNGWSTNAGVFSVIDAAADGYITTVGNGYTGGEFPVSLQVDSANAVDTEWSGYVDFKVSRTTNGWDGGSVVEFGLSAVDSYLNPGNTSGGDEWNIRISTSAAGGDDTLGISIQTSPGWATLAELTPAEAGWDGAGGTDLETDNIRLLYHVRKTRVDMSYEITASYINLDQAITNGGLTTVQTVSNAYNAVSLPYFVVQHDNGAVIGSPTERFDATIDAINLTVAENVPPVLETPVVNATGLDGLVELTWDSIFEAESYDVTWSSSSNGTYSAVPGGTGITTNAINHSGLINDTEYWYKVTAKATGAADAVSFVVSATPASVTLNETFIDTTFSAAEGYVLSDLAGQKRWKANANSVPNAFTVDPAGDGFANGFASAAKTNDSSVYWNELTSNTEGAVWNGTMKFRLSAANSPTTTRSDGETVAVFSAENQNVLGWGISSDVANTDLLQLHPVSGYDYIDDAVIRAWVQQDGDIEFSFNKRFFSGRDNLLSLSTDQIGWEPVSTDTNTVPDFETELMQVDWSIRKTTSENDYNATLTVTVGTNVYTGTLRYNELDPEDLWASETAQFVMQHIADSTDLIDVSVDSISVTHTNSSEIPVSAPIDLAATTGNVEVNLSWASAGGEELSFNVYRSDSGTDDSDFTLYTNLTGTAFTDSGLTTKTVYIYRITGVFSSGESDYVELPVMALAQGTVAGLWWGGNDDIVTKDQNFVLGTAATANGVDLYTASGDNGSFFNAADYNVVGSPLLYGWVQMNEGGAINQLKVDERAGDDVIRVRDNDGVVTTNATLFYVEVDTAVDASDGVLKLDSGTWGSNTRAAIRNGGTWYASEEVTINAPQSLDLATTTWASFATPVAGDPIVDVRDSTFTTVTFDQVDAVGVLRAWNDSTVNTLVRNWELVSGDKPSTFQSVMFDAGIYNDDAAFTNDYDGDGVDNGTEWGLSGDPTNADDDGVQALLTGMDESGNFLFIHPRLISEARPTYQVWADDDLVYTPAFELQTENVDYTRTSGGQWSTENWGSDLEVVTNAFPFGVEAVRFFKLKVVE